MSKKILIDETIGTERFVKKQIAGHGPHMGDSVRIMCFINSKQVKQGDWDRLRNAAKSKTVQAELN